MSDQNNKQDNKQDDKQKDFLISFHKSIVTDLHEAQRNFISLIVTVIGSMGVFGFGLKAFLDTPCSQNTIYFIVATIAAVILLLIVYFVANISGYTYRKYQIILCKGIEKKMKDKKILEEGIIPNSWDVCNNNKEYIDPPEIFKFFKLLAGFMIVEILLICGYVLFFFKVTEYCTTETKLLFFAVAIVFVLLLIGCLCARFRWNCLPFPWVENSYANKLKESCKKSEDEKINYVRR